MPRIYINCDEWQDMYAVNLADPKPTRFTPYGLEATITEAELLEMDRIFDEFNYLQSQLAEKFAKAAEARDKYLADRAKWDENDY